MNRPLSNVTSLSNVIAKMMKMGRRWNGLTRFTTEDSYYTNDNTTGGGHLTANGVPYYVVEIGNPEIYTYHPLTEAFKSLRKKQYNEGKRIQDRVMGW